MAGSVPAPGTEAALEFVDTNVLVYAHDVTAGDRHQRAAELVEHLARGRFGATSIQVMHEFYVTATRKLPRPLSGDRARRHLRALALWPTHAPRAADVIAATRLSETARISFWDAMILTSAAALRCATVWSEDLNDGQEIAGVSIRNPFRD